MSDTGLIDKDRRHFIHSALSWAEHERRGATLLESGDGIWLNDREGRRLLDGFSGLWCVNIGYGQQSVVDVAAEQMARLPYATSYFHFASEPAVELAARLAERAPGDLDHVFFTQGGSDAVDTAIRLIRYYFNVTGQPEKKHMIAVDRGYHGCSSSGSGMTGLGAFHNHFDVPTPTQHHIATAYPYRFEGSSADLIQASVAQLRAKVSEIGADKVAAFFAEPVVGSGGVIVPPDGWLKAMYDTCQELGILFVADEVITGFGRTGPLFGSSHDGVTPDIMTLAKGLTSGYVPMGATLLSDRIYRAITDGAGKAVIGHGQTYSGHPVSAAVGLEVLRLYEEGGIIANGQASGAHLARALARLEDHPLVGNVRSRGMLACLELVTNKTTKTRPDPSLGLPDILSRCGYERSVLFRAFGDAMIGLAPPLISTIAEVDELVARLTATLDDALEVPAVRDALRVQS
ncbi:adenosylmethionine-8-amino-7-oxononanoate aminotransferase [Novosphingobium chloroacetimidivorans]|uniref:Adenosylmethionine-8-amino-7-oxononanoate aminotransferase n=1 Tax=Novosphingobium chloroacetimidivorans TaxID=1428314 RepID=A0A7W7KAI6_9SPHN|nr:aminotransferase class III-fold pyridoxal phosphate-dependent enzyme [Novosphingobium chloroacetimidivorans]MBB4858613.1 adenosylmethionine-8-amino-7-oxononanoate aminotransferase [Novosphingobium chloroacetimidivorans]